MLFSDGVIFLDGRGFTPASLRVEEGIITEILPPDVREDGCVELRGAHVIPA